MALIYTTEEIEIAKSVDLCRVAEQLGYKVKKIGHYHTIAQMDSIRIYDRKSWYRWSDKTGGSQIDFLKEFAGMDVKDAIEWLLSFIGYHKSIDGTDTMTEKPELLVDGINQENTARNFSLPSSSSNNMRVMEYLTKNRGLSETTVKHFIDKGLLYESEPYHNAVFIGRDVSGKVRYASMRGTYDREGKSFKCDVRGSDKRYGFCYEVPDSDKVRVFEGAIDVMSYFDIVGGGDNLLALASTSDNALEQFLADHPSVRKIVLSLDNDPPGRNACVALIEKYRSKGYDISTESPPERFKDHNEWLIWTKNMDVNAQSEVRDLTKCSLGMQKVHSH